MGESRYARVAGLFAISRPASTIVVAVRSGAMGERDMPGGSDLNMLQQQYKGGSKNL